MPQLHTGGAPLRTGSRRALAMAVLLAVDREITRDRLADLLWPGTERGMARRNLRRDLFRLRQIGLDIVDGGSDTVSLQGLALEWPAPHGAPPPWLDGLESAAGQELDDWLVGQRPQLHRRWVQVLCERADAMEQHGDEAGALALWRAVLDEDVGGPDHAAARQAALRLHQQLGQHTQALTLGRGAGTVPTDVVAPARPAIATTAGFSGPMPFVGRTALLASVGEALARRQTVFIAGPAGAGKTRLALEAAASLGGTLHVRCRPEDGGDAFTSALRMLQALRDAAPDVELPTWVCQELSPLVPEWATDAATSGEKPAPAEQALLRMRRAFEAAWRTLARDNFAAVVLDDWQWADASSLALWAVEPAPAPDPAGPVAQIVVHRAGELPPAALERRRALVDAGLAVALQVPNLDGDELLRLVRQMSRSDGGERFAARLHQATSGNPLFLGETLRHLFATGLLEADAQGRWHTPYDAVTTDYAELAVPATVRDTVLARARALGPAVRRVLEAASLAGDGLTPRLLAGAAGLDEVSVASALEHAASADLLTEGRDGRYRFTHDLLAQSLADSLSGARRLALHGQLAERLIALDAAPGRIAQHLELAGLSSQAAHWHLRAGQAAQRRRAWGEALRHHERALAGTEDPEQRTRILMDTAATHVALGDPAATGAALDAALVEAARVGRTRTLDVLIARAAHWHGQNRQEEAAAALVAVAADPALTPAQAHQARQEHARALSQLGRHEEALATLLAAIEALPASALAERLGLVSAASRSSFWLGDLDGAARRTQQAYGLCQALGDDYRAAAVLGQLGTVARERGRTEEALQYQLRSREVAARAGNLHAHRVALYNLIIDATDDGRVDEAERLLGEGEALSPFWENPLFHQAFIEARYFLHYLRGQTAQARAAAAEVLARARALRHPHGHTGALILVFDLLLHVGEFDAAQALLDEADGVLAQAGGQAMRRDEVAARRVHLAQARGQHAQALALLDALLPQLDRMREDDKGRALASGLLAAVATADRRRARELKALADGLARPSIEVRVMLCTARLRCAQAWDDGLVAAREAARAQAAEPHLPAYVAGHLREALLSG